MPTGFASPKRVAASAATVAPVLLVMLLIATGTGHAQPSATVCGDAASLDDCFLSLGDWGGANPSVASIGVHMARFIGSNGTTVQLIRNDNNNNHGMSGGGGMMMPYGVPDVTNATYYCCRVTHVVALGDNFYIAGVDSIHDPLWQSVFVNQFRRPPNVSDPGTLAAVAAMPWIVSLGNHDYGVEGPNIVPNVTRAQAQITYGQLVDPNWHLPYFYYYKDVPLASASGQLSVRFIVVDTQALVGCYQSNDTAKMCIHPEQLNWLDGVLNASDVNASLAAVFVVGHHVVASPDAPEDHVDRGLDAVLVPRLKGHRVSAYLYGHNHFASFSREGNLTSTPFPIGGLAYIINGAGLGDGAYPCNFTGAQAYTVADLSDALCMPAALNQIGSFMVHRLVTHRDSNGESGANGYHGVEHCVVNGGDGTVAYCQQLPLRSAPTPMTPPPTTTSASSLPPPSVGAAGGASPTVIAAAALGALGGALVISIVAVAVARRLRFASRRAARADVASVDELHDGLVSA